MNKSIYIWCILVAMAAGAVAAVAQRRMQTLPAWQAGTAVSAETVARVGIDRCFAAEPLPDAVFERMQGRSYPAGCTVPRHSLRHVRVLHYDGEGIVRMGELVCHQRIAADLVYIFRELYRHRYPIERIRLIDDYGASDEQSMRANNTCSFCYRTVKGSAKLSAHARGMAVDVNALYNPYYKRHADGRVVVQPSNALKYCNRTASFPYKIERGDLLHRLFTQRGFKWGGAWRTVKDYQHFEKE